MIKILHLAKYHDGRYGGIEHISKIINKYFCKTYDITTLAFGRKELIVKQKNNNLILCKPNFIFSSQPLSIKYFIRAVTLSKKNNLIYLHYPNLLAFFCLLFIKKNKIIIHWHSDIIKQKIIYFFVKWIEKKILQRASMILVTSSNYLKASKPLKKFHNKITIVNFGMKDPLKNELFKFKTLPFSNKNTKKIKIMSIGRLVGYKGYIHLINSMIFLDKDRYHITIIGDGELKEKLKNQCRIKNIENNVDILSNINEKRKKSLFKDSHIFCLPSISKAEAYGLVLLEALSYGIPLITFKMPESGTNFINKNNINGVLVEERNSKELASNIIKITSNKKKYEKMSKNARIDYEKRFKEDFFIEKMSKIFSQMSNKL